MDVNSPQWRIFSRAMSQESVLHINIFLLAVYVTKLIGLALSFPLLQEHEPITTSFSPFFFFKV